MTPGADSDRLAKITRMLMSDKSGEVFAAVQIMKRTLGHAGLDMHELTTAFVGLVAKASGPDGDAALRLRWAYEAWRKSRKGGVYLKTVDYVVNIFPSKQESGKWGARVEYRGRESWSRKTFSTVDVAKTAALECLLNLRHLAVLSGDLN
jgi:hypothetical protein